MPASPRVLRMLALSILLVLIVTAILLLSITETGRHLMRQPHRLGDEARTWVATHSLLAPLILMLVFIAAATLMLPVWWIQILAGYGFGIFWGVVLCQIGATLGAVAAVSISRWLASGFVHEHLHGKLEALNHIDAKLGHNGLLVVMAIRLVHLLPFSVCSYVIGVTRISLTDVIAGNLLGGIPVTLLYVTLGADRERLTHFNFIAMIVAINLVLLIPLLVRYMRPQWFQKIGIE